MKKRYARVAYRFFYLGVYRYRYWGGAGDNYYQLQ